MRLVNCLAIVVTLTAWAQTFAQSSFEALLVGENVIRGGEVISSETEVAFGTFNLTTDPQDPSSTSLSYELVMPAFDIDGTRTADLGDDVTAIHLHTLEECVQATCIAGDSAGTKHVLNIFGNPRQDDVDLLVDANASTIRGIWDPSDANMLTPAPGQDPNDFLDALSEGNLFIMVHTREFPAGAVGGFLVPEPSAARLALIALVTLGLIRQRRGK